MPTSNVKKRNRNNRQRGKIYEKLIASVFNGVRNLDKSRPHTDVENKTHVYEVKSRQAKMPTLFDGAFKQLHLASKESKKREGGVVVVYTGGQGGKARAVLIQEIDLDRGSSS